VNFYKRSIAVFGVTFVCLGIALLVVTAVHGGGAFGFLIGTLFVALGIGRLYLLRSRS
jgi:hypothetical protein